VDCGFVFPGKSHLVVHVLGAELSHDSAQVDVLVGAQLVVGLVTQVRWHFRQILIAHFVLQDKL
jgi:hypothetical protein